MNPHSQLAAALRALHARRRDDYLIQRRLDASIRLFDHGPLLTRPQRRLAAAHLRKAT